MRMRDPCRRINSPLRGRMIKRCVTKTAGICCMLTGAFSMLLLATLGLLNVYVIIIPMAIFCMGAGLTFQNAGAAALEYFGHIAGAAGAIYGTLQISAGAIISGIMAILAEKSQVPLAITQLSLALLAIVAWRMANKAKLAQKLKENSEVTL